MNVRNELLPGGQQKILITLNTLFPARRFTLHSVWLNGFWSSAIITSATGNEDGLKSSPAAAA